MVRSDYGLQRNLLAFDTTSIAAHSGKVYRIDPDSELLPGGGNRDRLGAQVAGFLLAAKANAFDNSSELHLVKKRGPLGTQQQGQALPPQFTGSTVQWSGNIKVTVAQPSTGDASFDDSRDPIVARCASGKIKARWETPDFKDEESGKKWTLGAEASYSEYSYISWQQVDPPASLNSLNDGAQSASTAAGVSSASTASSPSPTKRPRPSTQRNTATIHLSRDLEEMHGSRRLIQVEGAAFGELNGRFKTKDKSSFRAKLSREPRPEDMAGGCVTAFTVLEKDNDQVFSFTLKRVFKVQAGGSSTQDEEGEELSQQELQQAVHLLKLSVPELPTHGNVEPAQHDAQAPQVLQQQVQALAEGMRCQDMRLDILEHALQEIVQGLRDALARIGRLQLQLEAREGSQPISAAAAAPAGSGGDDGGRLGDALLGVPWYPEQVDRPASVDGMQVDAGAMPRLGHPTALLSLMEFPAGAATLPDETAPTSAPGGWPPAAAAPLLPQLSGAGLSAGVRMPEAAAGISTQQAGGGIPLLPFGASFGHVHAPAAPAGGVEWEGLEGAVPVPAAPSIQFLPQAGPAGSLPSPMPQQELQQAPPEQRQQPPSAPLQQPVLPASALQNHIAAQLLSRYQGMDSMAVAEGLSAAMGLRTIHTDLIRLANEALYGLESEGRAVRRGIKPGSTKPLWWLA